jgi:hypothetical protein
VAERDVGIFRRTSITTSRQSWLVSRTLALSTEHSLPRRAMCGLKADAAMRRTSASLYDMMS